MMTHVVQGNPSHDHKSFAILVRQDLLADLAHLEPRLVSLLAKGYGVAERLWEPGETQEDDPNHGLWPPLARYLDRQLRFSRSKHGLRSNQLTSSLRGGEQHRDPSAHLAKQYQENAWSKP